MSEIDYGILEGVTILSLNKTTTKKLILLFLGLLLLYLLRKNGNFFPVFFIIVSVLIIFKYKTTDKTKDIKNLSVGIALAILSLNPIYGICIVLGYVAAKRIFDYSSNKILIFPREKKELLLYGLLPTAFLVFLNTIWMIQSNSLNFSFRISAITGSLIASIPEELLFRYFLFAVCVNIGKDQAFSKVQNFICYLILIVPHVLMHFPAGTTVTFIDFSLMSVFGIALTYIQRKSSLALAIIVHFLIDFFRILLFGI